MPPSLRTTKLSSRGQVVIPREFRQALNLHTGDTLAILRRRDELVLRPADALAVELEAREWQAAGLQSLGDVWDNPEDGEWAAELEALPALES